MLTATKATKEEQDKGPMAAVEPINPSLLPDDVYFALMRLHIARDNRAKQAEKPAT